MRFFRSAPIGVRIGCGFAVLLLLAMALGAVGWWQLRAMNTGFNTLSRDVLPFLDVIARIENSANELRQLQMRYAAATDSSGIKPQVSIAQDARKALEETYQGFAPAQLVSEEELKAWEALGTSMQGYLKLTLAMEAKTLASVELFGDERKEALYWVKLQNDGQVQSAFQSMRADIEILHTLGRKRATEQIDAGERNFKLAAAILASVTLATLVLGIAMAVLLTRGVVVPIAQASACLRQMASGDLNTTIDTSRQDELGQMMVSLLALRDSLRRVIDEIRGSSASVAGAAGEITAGTVDLSSRTEVQAASLQQTAAAMTALTSMVKRNALTAREVDGLAGEARTAAGSGAQVVDQVVSTMDNIQKASNRIGEITAVIDGIAFQTNILALNAAVEAARAGEHGRGFAIVATEVRNLAHRSSSAAKEIRTLISDSAEKVQDGAKLVGEAGQRMADIRKQVEQVSTLIGEIRTTAATQSNDIEQVSRAVDSLDQGTQQNAALVEQASAAAESLKQQSHKLVASISVFTV